MSRSRPERRTLACAGALILAALVTTSGYAQAAAAQGAPSPAPAATPMPFAAGQRPVIRPMAELAIAATIKVGRTADWVTITADKVWVGSTGPNAVHEIDPKTNAVYSIELPGRPCAGLASDRDTVWVPMCGPTPQLAKVDLKTRKISGVFPVGPPQGEGSIALGAGSVWLVTDKTGSLARIDPMTGAVKKVIQLRGGSYNPVFGNGLIWVSRVDGAEVTVVDPKTDTIVTTLTVGPHPRFIAAGGGSVWTLNQGDGTISRIDAVKRVVAPPQPLETPGHGGDIAFHDGRVWTTMMQTPLMVSDGRTGAPICQWKGEGGDSLNVGHGSVWLTNLRAGTVSRIPLDKLPADCRARN